jgi:hypothetical protein
VRERLNPLAVARAAELGAAVRPFGGGDGSSSSSSSGSGGGAVGAGDGAHVDEAPLLPGVAEAPPTAAPPRAPTPEPHPPPRHPPRAAVSTAGAAATTTAAAAAAATSAVRALAALFSRGGGARARPLSSAAPLEGTSGDPRRGEHRVRSAEESLAAARAAARAAEALRAMLGARASMTELEAATLLQARWRALRARRTRGFWVKINAFESRKALRGGEAAGGAAGGAPAEVAGPRGWVRRVNRLSGKAYFLHVETGRAQWEAPEEM